MTVPFTLRQAAVADAALVSDFAARTFYETFGPDNDPAHMAAHLASAYSLEQQSRELTDPDIVTLLLEAEPALAGYAMVRRAEAPPCVADRTSIELWRFYIDQPWHGRGAARRLMAAVHEAAAGFRASSVWLSVWERNPRARAFYRKYGYEDVGSGTFMVGGDRQTDRILVMPVTVEP